jgi:hypothetical protein
MNFVQMYRTITLPVDLYACETLREESRIRVFENLVLRKTFGPKRDKVTRDGSKYITRNLMISTHNPIFFR